MAFNKKSYLRKQVEKEKERLFVTSSGHIKDIVFYLFELQDTFHSLKQDPSRISEIPNLLTEIQKLILASSISSIGSPSKAVITIVDCKKEVGNLIDLGKSKEIEEVLALSLIVSSITNMIYKLYCYTYNEQDASYIVKNILNIKEFDDYLEEHKISKKEYSF